MLSRRLKNWNTMPMCLRRIRARSSSVRPVMTSPSIVIVPSSGTSRPATRFSSVDLPQPDGPITATNSPAAMSRSTPRRARTGASSASNVLRTPTTVHTFSIPQSFRSSSPSAGRRPPASLVPSRTRRRAGSTAGRPAARRASRPTAPCPGGRARSCSRCARFTVSPTTVYSSRSSEPSNAAATSPVDSPMPRPNSGSPSARHLSLTASWRSCIAQAACTRVAAWSSCGNGAPNTAITASPTYCMTVPPSRGSRRSSRRGAC